MELQNGKNDKKIILELNNWIQIYYLTHKTFDSIHVDKKIALSADICDFRYTFRRHAVSRVKGPGARPIFQSEESGSPCSNQHDLKNWRKPRLIVWRGIQR